MHRRLSSHQAPAALCLRRGQPAEGGGARARRRHHRSRHGQSGHADAAAHRRQADRDGRQAAHASLFGVEGHSRACARAQAAYYERRFGVKLDPETQVVATLGSKEGFANMAQAITAPGDVILVPNPTYPIHEFGFIISGAAIRHVAGLRRRRFPARGRARRASTRSRSRSRWSCPIRPIRRR